MTSETLARANETTSATALRWLRVPALLVLAIAGLNLLCDTVAYWAGPAPFSAVWDDSLMLPRYAQHILEYGAPIWNAGGQPTYGITGPYYLYAVILPLRMAGLTNPLALAVFASLICGVLFFLAIGFVLYRLVPGSVNARTLALGIVAIPIAGAAPAIVFQWLSGMDTFFGLLYFTIYLALAIWQWRSRSLAASITVGLFGGLAFGARPDLLILTGSVPAVAFLLGRDRTEKRNALLAGVLLVAVVLLQMAFANYYFHSALPLSFYAKSTGLYPGLKRGGFVSTDNFLRFLHLYWILPFLIVLGAVAAPRTWWRDTLTLDKGLIAGVLLHTFYFLFFVAHIMGMMGRFYYPILPALLYLAVKAVLRILDKLPPNTAHGVEAAPARIRWLVTLTPLLLILPTYSSLNQFKTLLHGNFASMNLTAEYRAYQRGYWFGLDRFSQLPPGATMATTEIGHVGAMNIDRPVYDMAGLNDPLFARQRFSSHVFFDHYRPDLIYMPHPGYTAMNQDLESDPVFRRDYEWIPQAKIGDPELGIALKKTSPYYAQMHEDVVEACAEKGQPVCKLYDPASRMHGVLIVQSPG